MESPDIYIGVWRDCSTAGLDANILTLPLPSARYLISALTFLLTLAVMSYWTIAACVLHQYRVSPTQSVDPFHVQLQVLLRNVETPTAALWDMWKIHQAWKETEVRQRNRILLTALVSGNHCGGDSPS
ncbi:hypothetical protein B0J13DRAFT_434705 [Dactylonectria estremocensis]|uniref:Uncharacterized protein n=1 Tax=Dactylonectria estremocensis TaxID=1079267 RepID=A0A9P9JGL7_9HYPO|nr:hypothetical protein B0J13DRAFT_434705 [Dactylonectria estremocensis]